MTNMAICIDAVLTLYKFSVMQMEFSYSAISTKTMLRKDVFLLDSRSYHVVVFKGPPTNFGNLSKD